MWEINVLLFWAQIHPVQFLHLDFLKIFLVCGSNYETSSIWIGSHTVSFNRITKVSYSPFNICFSDAFHNIRLKRRKIDLVLINYYHIQIMIKTLDIFQYRIRIFFNSYVKRLHYRLRISYLHFPQPSFTKCSAPLPSPSHKNVCLQVVFFSHFVFIAEFVVHFSFTCNIIGNFWRSVVLNWIFFFLNFK